MSATGIILLVVALVVVLVGFVFGLLAFIRRVQRRAVATAADHTDTVGATLLVPALMAGGLSDAGHQLNGNGVLALFPNEVRFVLGLPHRTMVIPHAAITSVAVTKHLKLPGMRRAGGPPWLIIVWTGRLGAQSTGFQTARSQELLGTLGAVGPTSPPAPFTPA